jgi:Leu/Phe-tRNA-protein transferase
VAASRSLARAGISVFDVQFATPHLRSLGVKEISRDDYLRRIALATQEHVDLSKLRLSVELPEDVEP